MASRPFQLESTEAVPSGMPLLTDENPNRYWLLSNGRAWKLGLGQNMGKIPPEIFAAASGVLFVGLYHGTAAAIRPEDGAVIDQVRLIRGNMVYWGDYGDLVAAVGETEIALFETGGKFLWRAALADVIDEIELKVGVFQLTDVSGVTARYDARTGRASELTPERSHPADRPGQGAK